MQAGQLKTKLEETADELREKIPGVETAGVVVQTGTGIDVLPVFDQVEAELDSHALSHMPDSPSPAGHSMKILFGSCGDRKILVFQGRRHLYEGHGVTPCVLPVCAAVAAGLKNVVLISAAGAVKDDFEPGTITVLTDFINNTGTSPLVGNQDIARVPFPDMTHAFSQRLNAEFVNAAYEEGVACRMGVFQANLGPQFETPAEVEIARAGGADTVGMSLVPETIAAHAMGADVLGIAVVANKAASYDCRGIDHGAVAENCARYSSNLSKALKTFLAAV